MKVDIACWLILTPTEKVHPRKYVINKAAVKSQYNRIKIMVIDHKSNVDAHLPSGKLT